MLGGQSPRCAWTDANIHFVNDRDRQKERERQKTRKREKREIESNDTVTVIPVVQVMTGLFAFQSKVGNLLQKSQS
jgi:hypothetical protein